MDITDFEPYLKQYYNTYSPFNLTYQAGPLYGMMSKVTKAGGKNMPVPQQYGNAQSTSSDFSVSYGNADSADSFAEFLIPSYPAMYSVVNIDEDLIAVSRSNEFAFQQALTNRIDSALREHGKRLALSLRGDGSGADGQVAVDGVSGNVVTLTDPTNVKRFTKGQKIITSDTKFSTTPTNVQTVTGVSGVAGTVTFDSLPSGTDDGWFLFNQGDYATSLGSKIVGVNAWNPTNATVAPWSTLFGTTRTDNPELLAGLSLDASQLTIKQAMIQGVQLIVANGGSPSATYKIFLNPMQYSMLLQTIDVSRVYTFLDTSVSGTNVSYPGVSYAGSGYKIEIYQDMWMDSTQMFIMDFDKWHFENTRHVSMMSSSGLDLIPVYNKDAVQLRIATNGQLACAAASGNCNVYNLAVTV